MTPSAHLVSYRGKSPSVSADAWLAPGVVLVGDVRVEAGASIWFGTVVRAEDGAVVIEQDANIQDGCVLHADQGHVLTVGANTSVGHRAVLHGCTVGRDALVGMGAVVLNDAVIGAGAMLAAGGVVLEGTHIPDGGLAAGVPAKVRRELSTEEREQVRQNGRIYTGLRDDYAAILPTTSEQR
ncbi:gamma carbonic anhydrase family protein [Ornithinimicrobium tianjinense]|uniref:Gamma carbonic anhydrase family protein n=1 Tax=Ornithinimicrobium tianjinense TaxID=1195761 RepID=A0A917BFK8_9MICO|nr:gamma carbonic anhydrase family protein [Ornithinimicrobium tianjinense]GGF40465.1 gamma carbonic anhydrase family protein [Ornithinimicrobium tianjinense]